MAMWIRQLEARDCAGIASASVSLQPGLNVLHGPNELGKSTLVKAIRATLLLPAGSTAGEQLRAWNVDGAPYVELTFEQEAQRIWRVRKRFGGSGQTYLELSRDGREFSQEGRGRGVDGSLQDILRWGIEPPGGKSGKRGMPSSFITTALLGDQRDIDAILETSLANDPNASGRERLTVALQALAEDPRFKQVLASVQERFDEAYTATGRRRSGRGSPWTRLREDRNDAEQREQETRQQLEHTASARSRVAELQQQAFEADAEKEQVADALKAAQAAERQRAEIAAATKALAAAEEDLRKAQAQVRSRDEKIAAVAAAEQEAEALRESLASAEQALAAVQPLAKAASERVKQLESGDAEQGRRLREQEAQNQHLKLTQRKTELEAKVAAAQQIAERESAIRNTQADIEQRTEALLEQRRLLGEAEAATVADKRGIEALERERAGARYLAAAERAQELAALAKTAKSLEKQAQTARAKAQELKAPARAELDELQQLDNDRQVAEGKLAVGLAIEFTPENAGTADVTLDGETRAREFNASERVRYEARRELRLAIDGVGVLRVWGGGLHLRHEAETATDRWRKLADSLFARAGVQTTTDLEDKRREADELLASADKQDDEAKQLRLRSGNTGELEQQMVVAQAEANQRREAAAKGLDPGVSVEDYIEEHGELRGDEELAREIETQQDKVRQRELLCGQLRPRVELEAGQLDRLQEELEDAQQELRDSTPKSEDWHRVLDEAKAKRQVLDEELAQVDAEILAIQAEATAAAEDARQALAKLRQEESAKTKARDDAKQLVLGAQMASERLKGEAETMRNTVEDLDVSALQTVRDEKQAFLDALPKVDGTPKDLAELERIASEAANNATSLHHELGTAQGALGQVGGQRIEEQAEQAKEARAALERREHELEVDYGGWKLLRETLAEAEREDASHLGDALVKPVSERMAALTNGRYGAVGIGPQLDATGIRLGGDERSFDDVSVGTREQIALLLRLAVAEALGSFVILDDHLTQSDPDRMAWIRGLLGEAARKIQVVVVTCHPAAYVVGEEHEVDLTRCIKRHEVGGPQTR